jgi:ABC-type branched-subunit amino acid transport system substrate-binding protein
MALRPHGAGREGQGQTIAAVSWFHCLAVGLACATLAGGAEAEDEALVVGLLLPPEEAASLSLRQGAELGIVHANQEPGRKATLQVRGRAGQWGDDGVEAARMVLDDGARGLIAPRGGAASHLSLQVAGRTGIPVVSLCGDSSVSSAGVPWMIRLAPRSTDEASAIFAGASRGPSKRRPSVSGEPTESAPRWAAFVPPGRAGREASRDLQAAAAAAGCSLAQPVEVTTNREELVQAAARVAAEKPAGVLLWVDPEPAGQLARALRNAGYPGLLAGPWHLHCAAFLQGAGAAAEGFSVPEIVREEASQAVWLRFAADYRRRYQSEPDAAAAMACDAAWLLVKVLRQTGTEAPHRAFPLTEGLAGATGALRFDGAGNRQAVLNLLVCREGRFIIAGNKP